jgi:hypothetical protein
VRLSFRIGGLPYDATWAFDAPRRLVTPADDEARLLSSDVAAENAFPFTPRPPRVPTGAELGQPTAPRPPSPVTALPTWHGQQRPAAAAASTAPPVGPGTGNPGGSGDSVVTPLRPVAAAASASTSATAPSTAPAAADESAGKQRQAGAGSAYSDALFGPVGPHKERLRGQTDQQAVNDGVTPGKRATVPSWDEIVFGTRRRKGE